MRTVPSVALAYFSLNECRQLTELAPSLPGVNSSSFICPVSRETGKISREINLSGGPGKKEGRKEGRGAIISGDQISRALFLVSSLPDPAWVSVRPTERPSMRPPMHSSFLCAFPSSVSSLGLGSLQGTQLAPRCHICVTIFTAFLPFFLHSSAFRIPQGGSSIDFLLARALALAPVLA